jgi:hypothetical protein
MASIRMAIMIATTRVPQLTISETIPQSLRYLVLPLNCNGSSDLTSRSGNTIILVIASVPRNHAARRRPMISLIAWQTSL